MYTYVQWYIWCIILSMQNTTTPEAVAKHPPVRNSPRIMAKKVGNISLLLNRWYCAKHQPFSGHCMFFFVLVMLSTYTIHPKLKVFFFFLQYYVLLYPDSVHRSDNYLAVATDIKKCVKHWRFCGYSHLATMISWTLIHITLINIIWIISSCCIFKQTCHYKFIISVDFIDEVHATFQESSSLYMYIVRYWNCIICITNY